MIDMHVNLISVCAPVDGNPDSEKWVLTLYFDNKKVAKKVLEQIKRVLNGCVQITSHQLMNNIVDVDYCNGIFTDIILHGNMADKLELVTVFKHRVYAIIFPGAQKIEGGTK